MSVILDLRKLEEFDRMALDGASGATSRLSGLTGVEATVGYSRLNVVTPDEVVAEFGTDDTLAVSIPIEGYLDGAVVTAFDRESAHQLADAFMPMLPSDDGYTNKHESAVEEICNVIVSGYVDGWADEQDDSIVMSPPEVVSSAIATDDDDGSGDDENRICEVVGDASYVISQRSSIKTPDDEVHFQMYLFLEESSTAALIGSDGEPDSIESDTLGILKSVIDDETETMVESMGELTGIELSIDLPTFDIVPSERLSESMSDDTAVGAVIELRDEPYGYLLVLFDEPSAREVAAAIDPKATEPTEDDVPFTERERSAIGEIGNVVSSVIVDGWADRFETGIEISPPLFVHDMRSSIVNDAVVNLGAEERFVLNFEATFEAEDVEFGCDVYTLVRPSDVPDGWYDE